MNKETIYIADNDDITDVLTKFKSSEKNLVVLVAPKKPTVLLSSLNLKLLARTSRSEHRALVLVSPDEKLRKLSLENGVAIAPSLKSRPTVPALKNGTTGAALRAPEAQPTLRAPGTTVSLKAANSAAALKAQELAALKAAGVTPAITASASGRALKAATSASRTAETAPKTTPTTPVSDAPEEPEDDAESLLSDISLEDRSTPVKSKKSARSKDKNKKISSADAISDETVENSAETDADFDSETAETDDTEEDDSESGTGNKKSSKSAKKSQKSTSAFWSRKKKWIIFFASSACVIALFFVWALIFAPGADISVDVRTTSSNFSENVNFSTSPADEEIASGVFYIHEESLDKDQKIDFVATGQKDLGEPASGELTIYIQKEKSYKLTVPAGTVFTHGGLEYVTLAEAKLSQDANKKTDTLENMSGQTYGYLFSTKVSVKAQSPGEKYNVEPEQAGWSSSDYPELSVYNSTAIAGGTSKMVKIIQQSDVDLALDKLTSDTKESGMNELLAKISDSVIPIAASFRIETSDPKVSPAVGEEVPDGTTPSVVSKTTYKIYSVDKTRIEDYIKLKANLEENTRIYSTGEPFIEYFTESDEKLYTARLKSTVKTGPKISETEILDRVSGQKIGRVEPILKDSFPGIAKVEVDKSFFWVSSVPSDPNKVNITLKIED